MRDRYIRSSASVGFEAGRCFESVQSERCLSFPPPLSLSLSLSLSLFHCRWVELHLEDEMWEKKELMDSSRHSFQMSPTCSDANLFLDETCTSYFLTVRNLATGWSFSITGPSLRPVYF